MKKTKIKSRAEVAVVAAAVIAVIALVNYASNSFFYRLDLTEDRQYTVSDATKRILRNLDDIVTIKAFFSKDLPPEWRNTVNTVRDLLSEYQNIAGGKLRITWEDPADNPEIVSSAQSLGVHATQFQVIKQDKIEAMMGYMGVGIMYADRKESIPTVRNLQNLEYDLTQAIMKVKRDAAPKVGLLKAQTADAIPAQIRGQMNMDNDVTDKKFAPVTQSLKADYDVVLVDVSEGKPIDKDIRTLIVPGGGRFNDRVAFEVDQYFMNGGNIIAMANAVNISFTQYGPQANIEENQLHALLEHYGVRIERNLIMDASCGHVMVPRNVGPFSINERLPYPYFVRIIESGFSKDNPAVSAQSDLMLGWASSLILVPDTAGAHSSVRATTLASSSAQSWAVTEPFDINPRPEYHLPSKEIMSPHALVMYLNGNFGSYFDGKPIPPLKEADPDDDDKMSQINLHGDDKDREVIKSTMNGNLVVIGDATFVSANNASQSSITFLLNVVDWLSQDNNLISVRSRVLRDKTINANVLEPGSSKPGMIRWVNLLLMPVLVAIAGIVISLRRRERIPAAAGAPAPAQTSGPAPKSTNANTANGTNKEDNVNE